MLVLIIRDGWGYGKKAKDNTESVQSLPTEEMLEKEYPKCLLDASAEAIGLPKDQIGTSEIGHMTIGAGRVVYDPLLHINHAIQSGELEKNPALQDAFSHVKSGGNLHFMGLLSPGGVHSHMDHLFALLLLAKKAGISKMYVHAFTDGRDVPPKSALRYFKAFDDFVKKNKIDCKIASVMGRYYAMDRDNRWEREALAYDAIVLGQGKRADNISKAIEESYAEGITDEFLKPIVTSEPRVKHEDTLIFFNFRLDRARELTEAFQKKSFEWFKRDYVDPYFVAMTKYEDDLTCPVIIQPVMLTNTLGEVISSKGMKQLRVAETEKYAHVTFFFNGLTDKVFKNEKRILVPSPKVATYDLKPEMSAGEITEKLVTEMRKKKFEFFVINYANADMVAHTGMIDKTIAAVKIVDECVGKVLEEVKLQGGITVITADHGNCEDMWDEKENQPKTAHTLNKVRLFVVSEDPLIKKIKLKDGGLANIAPTILKLMHISQPEEMTEKALF
jgi:2,3-bisphosphoglycerate-independent phosphoglycerate mutase